MQPGLKLSFMDQANLRQLHTANYSPKKCRKISISRATSVTKKMHDKMALVLRVCTINGTKCYQGQKNSFQQSSNDCLVRAFNLKFRQRALLLLFLIPVQILRQVPLQMEGLY